MYNHGTGLLDIDATSVRTITLQTDTIGSESGEIDFTFTSLANVPLINGISLHGLSNVAHGASNSVVALSNVAMPAIIDTANQLFQLTDPRSVWTSNVARTTSNMLYGTTEPRAVYGSNMARYITDQVMLVTEPMALFGSNLAVAASNAFFGNLQSTAAQLSNLQTTFASSNVAVNQVTSRGLELFTAANKIKYNDWIVDGPTFTQDNTIAAAGVTLGAAGIASSLGGQLLSQNGQLGASVLEDIGQKLGEQALEEDYDPTENSSNLNVHWNSLLFVPFHKNRGDGPIGLSNSLYLSSNSCKIFSVPATDLTLVDGGRYRRIAAIPTSNLLIDVGAQQYYGNDFFASSNVNTLNLNSTNVFTTSVQSTDVVADTVRVGSFRVRADGVWRGDPVADPLGAQQIIDSLGNYIGPVERSQIVGESFNFSKMGDGVMALSGFGAAPTVPADSLIPFFSL